MAILGFKLFDLLAPFNLEQEICQVPNAKAVGLVATSRCHHGPLDRLCCQSRSCGAPALSVPRPDAENWTMPLTYDGNDGGITPSANRGSPQGVSQRMGRGYRMKCCRTMGTKAVGLAGQRTLPPKLKNVGFSCGNCEKQNVAVAIVCAGMVLGICLIVVASVL